MKGLILINSYSRNEEYFYQPQRLKQEFNALNVEIDIMRDDFFPCAIINDNLECSIKSTYDFCIFLDKDKYILKAIDQTDIPLFNSYNSITVCDDKMLTYLALASKSIPMPKTLPGLLCYNKEAIIEDSTINNVEKSFGYPLIIKESYGSLGKGVYLVHNRQQLCETMEKVKCLPHLFQEFISTSFGKDIRVIVIGGKVLGGMLRSSKGDFRSNLGAGGQGKKFELTEEMIELCKRVADILKLDYCGIDLLIGENKKPIVCEVNSNAFFFGFEKNTKVNVAKEYAEFVIKKLTK